MLHRAWKLTYAEKLCISLNRLYLHVLKLTPAGSGVVHQSGLVGHTISFPQDGPVSVLSSEPTNVHGTEVRPLSLLAQGVLATLRVAFVAPTSMKEQLKNSQMVSRGRPAVLGATLRILEGSNALYVEVYAVDYN